MANKKYYWLKLKEDFFRQKEIKKLRKIAGGDTYTVIYLKMLLIAMNNDNKIYFEGVEDDFSEELALELDEDSDNVKMTLAFLQSQKLIEMVNEDEFLLPYCKDMIGTEKTSTERVRKHRLKKKEEQKKLDCNVSCNGSNVSCNENETLDIDIEKDIEIEIEKEKDIYIEKEDAGKYVNNSKNNLKQFSILYEKNIGLVNGVTAEWIIEMSETIDSKLFKRAIEIATDKGKCSLGYIKGIIKQWLDANIKTYEQLEAYQLQKKSQKEVKPDVRERKGITEAESSNDDTESEEYRRLLDKCRRLSGEEL